MSFLDNLYEEVISPIGDLVADGMSATGRGVDAVIDTLKEHPAKTTLIAGVVLAAAGKSLANSFVDNVFREKVTPVPGSILYCDLAFCIEHSGIYLGGGQIAHLDGSGQIEIVSPEIFLGRLRGWNVARSVYVSCADDIAVGCTHIAKRAKAMAGTRRDYSLILDNCHRFVSGCITGNFENSDRFWWMLKQQVEQRLGATAWRVWGDC